MSEHDFWKGAAWGAGILIAAFFIMGGGFEVHEGAMKRDCDRYGKTTLNDTIYTCSPQNGGGGA